MSTMRPDITARMTGEWPWPFGLSDLTFGLRRYHDDTTLSVSQIELISLPDRKPSIGRVRGIRVDYEGAEGSGSCGLVLKEPQGTTRIGLAGAGKREVGLYESLAIHLPVDTPHMLVGSPLGDWLILELIEGSKDPQDWDAGDYTNAIDQLAMLHDRFWSLDGDLSTFPWLGRPLDADFDVYVTAAQKAFLGLRESGKPTQLADISERLELIATLIDSADLIAAPLLSEPFTLLHGDYWPGNISVLETTQQIVYDWQLASVGPGIMDLLAFVYNSTWWYDDLPLTAEQQVNHYLQRIAELTGKTWSKRDWSKLWDHALMWRFLQEWIGLLAQTPEPLMEMWAGRLEAVWIGPVRQAVGRRL